MMLFQYLNHSISSYLATSDFCSSFHSPNLKEAFELRVQNMDKVGSTSAQFERSFGGCLEDPNEQA
jgi:hypothetical protein